MITHATTAMGTTIVPVRSQTNAAKVEQLQAALAELLAGALRRGFHGTAAVEVSIQDGTIQHIRRRLEQIER